MPTEADAEIGAAEITVGANTQPAESAVTGLMTKVQQIGNQMTGQSSSGFAAFGTAAAGQLRTVTNGATQLGLALGPSSPLGAAIPSLGLVQAGFDNIAAAEQRAEIQGRNFAAIGPIISGVGLAVAGVGIALTRLGQPLQQAKADLKTAFENTGQQVSDYSDQLGGAISQGQKYGFTNDQVQETLARLTAATKDPAEAFNELTFTESLAQAAHEKLTTAGNQVAAMHAGLYRSLRQFGIYIPQVRTSADGLTNAYKNQTDAAEKLQKAKQSLADFEARTEQEVAQKKAAADEALMTAQNRVDSLTEREQLLSQQYADQDAARADQTAQAVEDSTQRQTDALQSLQDIKDRMDAKSSQSQETQMALADAEMRLNDAKVKVATSSGEKQQSAIEEERNAQEAYTRAKFAADDQQKQNAKDLQKATEAVQKADEGHTKALQDQDNAAYTATTHQQQLITTHKELAKAQTDLKKAQVTDTAAGAPTLSQQQEEKRLQQSVTEATKKKGESDTKVEEQLNIQKRINEGFIKAEQEFMAREGGILKNRENTWAGHVAKIKAWFQNTLESAGGAAPALIGAGGLITGVGMGVNAARSIGRGIGKLGSKIGGRGGIADEIDAVLPESALPGATVGRDPATGRFTKLGSEAKTAASDVSGSVSNIEREAKTVGAAEKEVGPLGTAFTNIGVGVKMLGSSIGSAIGGIVSGAAAIAGAGWAAIAPWLPWIALAAAIVAVGYLIYRNWDTIKELLGKVWDWIKEKAMGVWNGIKDLFTGLVGFFKDHMEQIAFFFLAGGPLGLALDWLIHHWGEVWGGIKDVFNTVKNDILGIYKSMIDGILGGMAGLVGGLARLPGPLGAPFRAVKDILKGLQGDIDGVFDKLMGKDTTSKAAATGQAIAAGVSTGMNGGILGVAVASAGLVDAAHASATTKAKISSPSKLFADSVGLPMAQGVAQGMIRGMSDIKRAGQDMIVIPQRGQNPVVTMPYQPPAPPTNQDSGRWRDAKVLHIEPHFTQEISPLHAAKQIAWSLDDLG